MGTCFTKTEYVSGRQLHMNFSFKRRTSSSCLSSADASKISSKAENEIKSDKNLRKNAKCIHGTKGIQGRYNRWISRRQALFYKNDHEYHVEYSTTDQGE